MTSRKRKNSSSSLSDALRSVRSKRSAQQQSSRTKRRQNILETLESRQLLAGPQLIGIQPNEGDLIINGSVLETAPQVLTLRFDEDQQINPDTLAGIQVSRAGDDGLLGTNDDIAIVPGLVSIGDSNSNEVIVRFSGTLPDDKYKLDVFGFDDQGLGVTGLRNSEGELFQPRGNGQRVQTTEFDLKLGTLIESIVPQPVVRLPNGSLVQNRNEIVVYFNDDALFVEDDSAAGVVAIGGQEITINGVLTSRAFDDTEILFSQSLTATTATAVHDALARTVTVSYPAGTDFQSIASAIDALDEFDASVTAGSPVAEFVLPIDPSLHFTVKGNPTVRSAESPRFYQLLLTQGTVRTTDDALYHPDEVIYDSVTNTARLFFNFNADGTPIDDINDLGPDADGNAGVGLGGGTFRLRIGAAVDDRVDVILPPLQVAVAPSAITDFGISDFAITFRSKLTGENASGRQVRFEDVGNTGLTARLDPDGTVVFDLGATIPTIQELADIAASTPLVQDVIEITFAQGGVPGAGGALALPSRIVGSPPLTMTAVGDTLGTALDVGIFGQADQLTSLVFRESIDAQPFDIELVGGLDDPGHSEIPKIAGELLQHINDNFGADTTDGITEIPYNFAGVFDTDDNGNNFLNQITERHKVRIREALGLWSNSIGVQFRETADQGITFALGDILDLQPRPAVDIDPVSQDALSATLRIDPTFAESAIVFSKTEDYGLDYGEDFLRKATAGIGLILGLEQSPDLPSQTLLRLDPVFLNDTINPSDPLTSQVDPLDIGVPQRDLRNLEPVFPGNYDVLHGNYLFRSDAIDVDLYRFQVDLNDADRVGTLTAETFSERLADSSLLDTTLTLFQQQNASVVTDFGIGTQLQVQIDSLLEGLRGNNSRLDFLQTDRLAGDTAIRITQPLDNAGTPIPNGILIDVPRVSGAITEVPVGDVIDAINNDPFASSIFRATLVTGSAASDIGSNDLNFAPLLLSGGGVNQLSRNDDYFSEDSRIIASLGAGVYYIGVAASGNDNYDPTIQGSGYGGRTQGEYELHLKFEPQVDEIGVIRDLDSDRVDVPGTPIDGDGDGRPGGVNNFWFQTRALNRMIDFTEDGSAVTQGQTIRVTGGSGVVRTYEFVPLGGTARPGNVAVLYNSGNTGFPTPPSSLASALQSAINSRRNETGVSIGTNGATVIFDGERSIEVSSTFRGAEVLGRNLFVDKTAGPQADGSLDNPFNNIANAAVANAFGSALSGDIVRIVGNGGSDSDITTTADNFSYQIGVSDTGGQSLEDGRTMEVPQGVTTMIDAGAAFKLRNARIGVGSSSVQLDRSGGALQVLGTPRLVELSLQGEPVKTQIVGDANVGASGFDDGRVIFTSTRDRAVDTVAAGINPPPASGNWGGLVFRRDVDQAEGRRDLEDEGIFLQSVNFADLRYGGTGNLLIDSVQQIVNPIQIINLRPTISYNEILFSADAAISAAPNSFEETSFQAPKFQVNGAFTADYSRVGPSIYGNVLIDNSLNGLFIRSTTTPVSPPQFVTTSVRFDDTSIVHVIAENLTVQGNPGGSVTDGFSPNLAATSGRELSGGKLQPADYQYRMTFVDGDGFESLSTAAGNAFNVRVTGSDSSVEMIGLLSVQQEDYVSRRLYRANMSTGSAPVFELVASLDSSSQSFIDDGSSLGGILDLNASGRRGRLDGSLVFDPGLVVKMLGARIELGQGTQLLAEGTAENPVVFTGVLDDRFGAGGTFDTNNDNGLITPPGVPVRGAWSGLYAGPTSRISIDNGIIAYGGGISLIGGKSRGFASVEIQQAEARITNTSFEFNDDGQDGTGAVGREGRLGITPSTIFVRGAQPTIVGNRFIDNRGTIIAIDSDSLNADYVLDVGRSTGDNDRFSDLDDNYGPLIRNNRYQNVPADILSEKQISGLDIRGGELTTESVWDDTDIVHLLTDTIVVGNLHSSGGLLLKSRPEESLVIKLSGAGTPNSPTLGTGFTATGTPADIADRIGGTIQIVGLPGAPVVLTSFKDDTVGAGLTPQGSQFTDTNGDSFGSRPAPNDWRSILLDQYSNDRNVDFVLERELSTAVPPGFNGSTENAQVLGELAPSIDVGDDERRIGFEVEGYLSGPTDVDTYSFVGSPGTEVWIDIDKTLFQVDTVIELLDVSGNLLGRSDNSFAEIAGDEDVLINGSQPSNIGTLQTGADEYANFGAGGLYEDVNSTNPRDAGIRFTLPGTQSNLDSRSVYFFRVRSASVNPDDAAGGLTKGGYRFQLRLAEDQEFSGSVVRFADIRYANNGIHIRGLPGESPLLGDAQENEGVGSAGFFSPSTGSNDRIITPPGTYTDITALRPPGPPPGDRPQNLGNFVGNKKNVISVGGRLDQGSDVDFYQIDLDFNLGTDLFQSVVFDIDYAGGSRPDTNLSVFYDPDGEFGPAEARLVLFGQDSNIAEDQISPLGAADTIERLIRGSAGTQDAFIGPVSLPEGSYYVAVTEATSLPLELIDNPLVRREPISSVQRLFEDRIDSVPSDTFSGPRYPELFTDASIAAGGFVTTLNRANDLGHGVQQNIDKTNFGFVSPEVFYEEGQPAFLDGPLLPNDFGNLPDNTALDLETLDWSIADNNEIGGLFVGASPNTGIAENTSTILPHVTVAGNISGGDSDFYRVVIPNDESRVIVDIDRGFNPFPNNDNSDPESIPMTVIVLQTDPVTGFVSVVGQAGGTNPYDGRDGSAPSNGFPPRLSLVAPDPFSDGTLDAGEYFFVAASSGTTITVNATTGEVTVNPGPFSGSYRMQLSVEDHALPAVPPSNESLFFGRAPFIDGQVSSEAFDLTGYSAGDLPNFYFNYFADIDVTDEFSYTVTSDQDPVGITVFNDQAPDDNPFDDLVSNLFNDPAWRQGIVSLADFAGDTNVQITFDYDSGFGILGDGLYLDDFIVGFAERGETVFNGRGSQDRFTFGTGNPGEYQLEVRTATEYSEEVEFLPDDATPSQVPEIRQTLLRDFDTNDRQSQEITIVVPSGAQLSDGDTFTISDGSVTQRFEFSSDPFTSFGNVAVPFAASDSSALIAERIRTSINQTSQLNVEAASASGIDSGAHTDNRLNLFGAVDGSFLTVASPQAAPGSLGVNADGDLLMPAMLHNGLGDSNYRRIQSAVIIENNEISDARAIGIWSEPGDRDIDPQDLRESPFSPIYAMDPFEEQPVVVPHPFMQQPPVGNVYPGAVRNLPTLNDSVIGGLAPGVVVRNNTVDQAGLAGIKIQGQTRPFVLDLMDGSNTPIINDGMMMAIDAGGTRVVFEFEDISGAPIPAGGSGIIGGNGVADGRVPIYYRRIDGRPYNGRGYGYTSFELMLAIQQSIQGSILVTNGMTELVKSYVGPSLNTREEFLERFYLTPESFTTAALYIEGASNVYFIGGNAPNVSLVPVGEAAQPFAKVVNNTVYGADGIESSFFDLPTEETNDLLSEAVITRVGRAHTGPYVENGIIGDNASSFITPVNDVDIFQVELVVGDRLIVDIDTVANGPDTSVRVFDAFGIAQTLDVIQGIPETVITEGTAPQHLDPQSSVNNPSNDGGRTVFDPFVDFTALSTGTFYVAVSSAGNENYDPNRLSGRTDGAGGTGDYQIGLEVYAPRSVVLSLDGSQGTGSLGANLIGTTFTVTQIPDFAPGTPNTPGGNVNTTGNQITFEFAVAGGRVRPNGNINVALLPEYRTPDIMRAISNAVTGFQDVSEDTDIPTIPNNENGNGPNGRTGPITRARATALGGAMGDNLGLVNRSTRPFSGSTPPLHWIFQNGTDFDRGFGHDRREIASRNILLPGSATDGIGTTELYVLFENIAGIELSPQARAAGLTLSPDAARPQFSESSDQLIAEAGIWVTGGASPTLLNNVLSNLHQSVLVEETNFLGFGKRVDVFGDSFVKPQQVLAVGNAFQYDESRNTAIRSNARWQLETSLSTDNVIGAINVSDQNDDFNFVIPVNQPLFVNAAGNNFLPADGSSLIDSAISSIDDRGEYLQVKDAVGLSASNVIAPNRDVRGVLRADNPNFATPGSLGSSVFKDRGSNELADFVGPFAIAEIPRDNDAAGVDTDPATSFISLNGGTYDQFRIQLRDTGDESDPFTGFGVDDRTVIVSEIDQLRSNGANLTLFEDGRLLTEGIDYSFNYNATSDTITLTPLAGIWENDRSYRIALNNQDRTVLIAPDASTVQDGDQLSIIDSNGGTLVFEFESGFSMLVPEPITFVVPQVGTNAGGLSDGDIFQINDGVNPIVVFELDQDGATLPGTVPVPLPAGQTPTVPADLIVFLEQIASNIGAAIQTTIDSNLIDADVRVIGTRVVVGMEPNATATTALSGLQQLPRTLALQVPTAGIGVGGIADGDTFVINNGSNAITFEFDTGNGLNNTNNTVVPVAGITAAVDVAIAINDAIGDANLGLNPSIENNGLAVYMNLPLDGGASVPRGQLSLVSLTRTATDADTILITPTDGSPAITLEINRTDEPDPNGGTINDGVTAPNVPINIDRATTANELAGLINNAIQGLPPIAGLSPNDLQVINGGLLTIGGEEGLGFAVTSSSLQVIGSPSVTGSSTIQVFGPLILSLPLVGGGAIQDGSVMVITDDTGSDVIFEFNLNGTFPSVSGSILVPYDSFSTFDVVADNLATAINAANVGVTAQNIGVGQVSLGRIDQSRVNINGIFDPNNPLNSIPGLTGSTLRRGIVNDGEVLSIRQGSVTVTFEFEAAVGGGGVGVGNVPVPFQPGSTIGDVAVSLASTINNNKGSLRISASAELDANGVPTGQVLLDDQPGTVIDVFQAPTLNLVGVPGGAIPIRFSPAFSAVQVKLSMINAINSVNQPGQPVLTPLSAENRGGPTFFVSNGVFFNDLIENFSLPAITDLAGNPLEANRSDLSTQFTILMPTVGLDFGDAPDPVNQVNGRYPTRNSNNGPRHVVDDRLFLGSFVDADLDGVPGVAADGDDSLIAISSEGTLFQTSVVDGFAQIVIQSDSIDPLTRDGDTITIDIGVSVATLEFDVNGRFDEDNYAIRPADPTSADSIAEAIIAAIGESPLESGSVESNNGTVLVSTDDEDGVIFISEANPTGVLNQGVSTPIEVSVTGAGVLEAWIDFNADGDWDDPGEQIIPMSESEIFDDRRAEICPVNLTGIASNIFADTGGESSRSFCIVVPPTAPVPLEAITTYARFRVSREGGLSPEGLALSGEVEDYAITLLPGTPPQISQPNRSFVVQEDRPLQALDINGNLTSTTNDDGLLAGVVDLDGDNVVIFSGDVGIQTLTTIDGTVAGELDLASDGTFAFLPVQDFNGVVNFTARVSDVQPLTPENELVSSRPINVTINVIPVNDPPVAVVSDVIVNRTIDEDSVQSFSIFDGIAGDGLIGDKYLPGPANELSQSMIIESVGSIRGSFLTSLGGTLAIIDNGETVIYTPPADYNGAVQDTFNYVVADVPGAGQLTETATKQGTVSIGFIAVNDPPRTTDDNFSTQEDVPLTILVNGDNTNPGILDNDTAGPQDEVDPPQSQTISLVANQFPKATLQGGVVSLVNNDLLYTPPALFSGVDVFQYAVQDNLGAVATANVSVNVGGVNNAPRFIGINGVPGRDSITRDEAKLQTEREAFDLTTWFIDPEDDAMVFTVTSTNASVANASVIGDTLIIEYPPFGFGQASLTVTATDPSGAGVATPIAVTVVNTPDPPSVIGTLNPLSGIEDQVVVADLGGVFADPDGEPLTYSVARLGSIINPTLEQIASHPLVRRIDFAGDQLRISLQPDQFGAVEVEIAATDGSFRVSDTFTLTITGVEDNPIARPDSYNVPIGSQLSILSPNNGLLRNDTDADGNTITVDLSSVTSPTLGTLDVNADGTFVYTSTIGNVNDVDSFSYRVIDSTGRLSDTVNVSLTMNRSRYQNPLADLSEDVNADGLVSAIDALRIINFLNRELTDGGATFVPVSEIGAPPPDYYDTNGDGRVSASDALQVINRLATQAGGEGEAIAGSASLGVTQSFVSGSAANLPVRNLQPVAENRESTTRDQLLASGFEIATATTEQAVDAVVESDLGTATSTPSSVDQALSSFLDELTLDGPLE